MELVWAYVLAGVLAAIAYAFSALAVRYLTRSSDGVPQSALGLTGVTKSTISAAGGEVSLDGPGELERRLAYSDDPDRRGRASPSGRARGHPRQGRGRVTARPRARAPDPRPGAHPGATPRHAERRTTASVTTPYLVLTCTIPPCTTRPPKGPMLTPS